MVTRLVLRLRVADMTEFKAKNIFRASRLSLLGVSNFHVQKKQKRIAAGKPVSPLLLVRDQQNGRVAVAGGYHRICAVIAHNEDVLLPVKSFSLRVSSFLIFRLRLRGRSPFKS